MKIAPTQRVIYGKNPLAEVICQIRFQRLEFDADFIQRFQRNLSGFGYDQRHDEPSFNMVLETAQEGVPPIPRMTEGDTVHHFGKADGGSKVSVSCDFIAYSSTDYRTWDEYLPDLLRSVSVLSQEMRTPLITRIGLRYKDVIERSVLGLEGTPWHELIKPFLLGPLAQNALSEESQLDENSVDSQVSQCLMRLDECRLLLQTSLLTSLTDSSRAFLIDADFFHEMDGTEETDNIAESSDELEALLETLHSNAGALFRHAITEKLHNALSPQ